MTESIILTGFFASLAAGLATVVGALPILSIGRPTEPLTVADDVREMPLPATV